MPVEPGLDGDILDGDIDDTAVPRRQAPITRMQHKKPRMGDGPLLEFTPSRRRGQGLQSFSVPFN
ncbi:MAG: hypothetical protein EBZ69_03010 [Alphaproteobacteria bacterium]|nr:hypothetical protein [Alphaproteobacteria bacterium]